MIRIALELALLFLIPTLAYLGYALLMRPNRPAGQVVNETPFVWLGLAGAALVLGTLLYYAVTNDISQGSSDQTYPPARIKEARIEPGHLK